MSDCEDSTSSLYENTITGVKDNADQCLDNLDSLSIRGLPVHNYPRPLSPTNFFVFHAYSTGIFDLQWDSPYVNPKNSEHNIIGVNLYRSIDSSEGPWTKVNTVPITVNFYRDASENINVVEEIVDPPDIYITPRNIFVKAKNFPLVVDEDDQRLQTDPDGITVTVDGEVVRTKSINPYTGEIEFYTVPQYDVLRERYYDLKVPTATSEVKLTYTYNTLFLQENKDISQRIFYKISSVASSGSETSMEDSPIASYQDLEAMFYIWKNAISKNQFLLEQAGERALVYIQRSSGVRCSKHDILDRQLYGESEWRNCSECFGTGFKGGYIGPFEVYIGPFDAETSYRYTSKGRVVSKNQETFIMNYPVLRQGDILVRKNGERFVLGAIRRKEPNGILVQQNFTVHIIQPSDILYLVTSPGLGSSHEVIEREEVPDYKEEKGKSPTFYNWHKSNV